MTAGDLVALMLLRDGLGGKVDHVLVLKDDEVQVLDDQWVRGGLGAAEHDEIVDLAVKILLAGGRPLRVHFAVRRLDVTPLHPALLTQSFPQGRVRLIRRQLLHERRLVINIQVSPHTLALRCAEVITDALEVVIRC